MKARTISVPPPVLHSILWYIDTLKIVDNKYLPFFGYKRLGISCTNICIYIPMDAETTNDQIPGIGFIFQLVTPSLVL